MGKIVYLSPSLQELNYGYGNYGTEEKRCNQIADVIQKVLKQHGVTVYRNKTTMTLSQAVIDSNKKAPDAHLAIHTNAYDSKTRGCEVFCHEIGVGLKGEKLARKVYPRISAITPTGDRGIKEGKNFYGSGSHIYELYNTVAAAALIEIDFHDNPDSAKWIISNIENIGIALARGVLDYLGITYKVNTESNTYYRVVTGSYSNKDNAEEQVKKLKKDGYDSFITTFKK